MQYIYATFCSSIHLLTQVDAMIWLLQKKKMPRKIMEMQVSLVCTDLDFSDKYPGEK